MPSTQIRSEIAGTVLRVEKQIGDAVSVDDTIALLECMKMEIPIVATAAGRITSLRIKEGETIAAGHLVAEVER